MPTDDLIESILDIIAPRDPDIEGKRFAIFEWPHERTPTDDEIRDLAQRIATAITDHA